MICCIECFKDSALKTMISSVGKIGDCEICGTKNTFIYDTECDKYLEEYLDELLDIYTCKDSLPKGYPKELLNNISVELYEKWGLFNIKPEKISEIIINICNETYKINPKIFTELVGISDLYDKDYLEKNCILKTHKWEEFLYSIKYTNRFHSDHINIKILEMLCESLSLELKKDTLLYRGRISNIDGFSKKEMGSPPANLVTAGRANSEGISCLYLADNVDTTIHEIRARDLDYISVGSFQLKKDIKIVDLTKLDKLSPFLDVYDPIWFATNINHLRKIESEIAKPLRRQDSVLDYLPTQYISDFVKHIGYSGIKYKSTLSSGNNFAVFSETCVKCIDVKVYHIDDLKYNYNELIK